MIETTNREGRFLAFYRRDARGVGERLARGLACGIGLALLLAPVALVRPGMGLPLVSLLLVQLLVVLAGLKLLAEASRRDRVTTSLHVGAGEIEVTAGRGPLAVSHALGPVETDRILLLRGSGSWADRYTVRAVAVTGATFDLAIGDRDEQAALDLALVVSQGLSVPLEDRRYPTDPSPAGESTPPIRVTTSGDANRTVLTWGYRERLRPRAALLALGAVVALATVLSFTRSPAGIAAISGLTVTLALGLTSHLVSALTVRRVTLRSDAVRIERTMAGLPLLRRLTLYEELAGVLVFRRGPFVTVHFRSSDHGGAILPFEEPGLAGWLKRRVERAAHAGMQRNLPFPPRPSSAG